jgi:type II secretory pathway predicted ATPase ExeA
MRRTCLPGFAPPVHSSFSLPKFIRNIQLMQPEHFGLAKEPFAEQPDPDLFFPEAERSVLLRRLYADLQKGIPIIRLTGPEGAGKTMLCQMLAHLLPDEFQAVLVPEPGGSFDELCRNIFQQLGLPPEQDSMTGLTALAEQRQGQGRQLLLLVDQAENMFPAALERLARTAFASKGSSFFFQVILAGQPALNERISQLAIYCPDITVPAGHAAASLTEAETGAYLSFRLKAAGLAAPAADRAFSREAVSKIFSQAQGNLRQTNSLARQALEQLWQEKRPLPVQKTDIALLHKKAVAAQKKTGRSSGRLIKFSALAALLLLTALLFHYNTALWQNSVGQLRHLFTAGAPEPKKLLPLPKELQLNTEPELPPEPEEPLEEEVAAQPVFEPLTTEEQQEAAEAPEDLAAEAASEEAVPSVTVETTEDEPAVAMEQESEPVPDEQSEGALPEEPLASPVAEVNEEDEVQDSAPPVQELTPVAQKKIVQLLPDRRKIKVAPPEQHVPQEEEREEPAPEPQEQAPVIDIPASVTAVPPPDANMLYQELHLAGSRLRTSINANKYTLQLLMLSSSDASAKIKEMIVRDEYLDHKAELRILRKQTLPTALFMFYGLYDSEAEAQRALNALPLFLRKHHPYILPVREALRKTAYLH